MAGKSRRRSPSAPAGKPRPRGQGADAPFRWVRSRHLDFYIAAAAGIVVFAALFLLLRPLAIHAGLMALFAVYLGLTARRLPGLTPEELRNHADESDAPAWLVMAVVVIVIGVAAVSLFLLVNGKVPPRPLPLTLGIAAVLLGWFAIHTMLGLHYAYEYYESPEKAGPDGQPVRGGLEFPGEAPPDGASFIYFSFVIAMTAQVSDVDVSSSKMRWLVLWHSVFSYFFNTVILAAAVNVVVTIGGMGGGS